MAEILRYAAFTPPGLPSDPEPQADGGTHAMGGNPAGVVLDAGGLDERDMLRIAAEVGYSETAFVLGGDERIRIRYFSPAVEVDFCGHATIAAAVAWAEQHGPGMLSLETNAGEVVVEVRAVEHGLRATLTSVPTELREVSDADLEEALASLDWRRDELDPSVPPRVAFGGVDHLILAASTRGRLARLEYDYDRLLRLMNARGWITLQLVFREQPDFFHARNPFPVGGVVEDPATGAAAAALGGYVRDLGLLEPPARFTISQGEDMGCPSQLEVEISDTDRRVRVSGLARLMGERAQKV